MIFLALIYLAFISLGLPDSLLGSSWPIMSVEFGSPVESAGIISMIISMGTIVSSLLAHRVIKRFGTGKVTVVSVAMTAFALLGFSLSGSFMWLPIFAIPLGLGAGAVDSGLNEFVAEHYEAKHMNWLHSFWGLGAMLGPILISALTQLGHNWRSGYLSVSVIQFVLVALLLFSLPMWKKYEKNSVNPNHDDSKHHKKQGKGLFAPLRAKGAIFAMLAFFLYTSVETSVALWGTSYLVRIKSIQPEIAAGWGSLFFLGITIGRMLSGFVSMKLNNEQLIRLGCILLLVGVVVLILPLPVIFSLVAFILIGLGLAPIFPSLLHQTPVYFGKYDPQASMGLQMAFAYTGTTLMPLIFGKLFSFVSFTLMPYVLLVFGIGLLISTVLLSIKAKDNASEA
ncbi:MAG: MFS transporter [Acetivibrionales bacterium]|jgi:fucose permease|nr:MFS transporter [Clostridiaceae bacterium]